MFPEGTFPGPVSPARGEVVGAEHEELLVPLCVDRPVGGGPRTVAEGVGVARLGEVGPVRHHRLGELDLFFGVPEVCLVERLAEHVEDLVAVKDPHPLGPQALGRVVVEVVQVHVIFGGGVARKYRVAVVNCLTVRTGRRLPNRDEFKLSPLGVTRAGKVFL